MVDSVTNNATTLARDLLAKVNSSERNRSKHQFSSANGNAQSTTGGKSEPKIDLRSEATP